MEWVQNKGYVTDAGLSVQEQLKIRRAARARFWRWPALDCLCLPMCRQVCGCSLFLGIHVVCMPSSVFVCLDYFDFVCLCLYLSS